jgi:hypothetical protein
MTAAARASAEPAMSTGQTTARRMNRARPGSVIDGSGGNYPAEARGADLEMNAR